jgi:hypothetical protein
MATVSWARRNAFDGIVEHFFWFVDRTPESTSARIG